MKSNGGHQRQQSGIDWNSVELLVAEWANAGWDVASRRSFRPLHFYLNVERLDGVLPPSVDGRLGVGLQKWPRLKVLTRRQSMRSAPVSLPLRCRQRRHAHRWNCAGFSLQSNQWLRLIECRLSGLWIDGLGGGIGRQPSRWNGC